MDIAGRRDSFLNITSLFIFFLIIMMPTRGSKATTNLLLTGETLSKNSDLGYPDNEASLKLGGDCNLVLFNDKGDKVWESDTVHYSIPWPECTLSFTDNGRLVLNGTWFFGEFSWITPNTNSKVGKYVALLHPEGKLSIYGPNVWAAGLGPEVSAEEENIGSGNIDNELVSSLKNVKSIPAVYNVLFSGQELYDDGKLTDGAYTFTLKDCELVLKNSSNELSWRTWTKGNGQNCLARLNHRAELVIVDDAINTVWSNGLALKDPGEYVLIMQQNGNIVIYGPEVWSTANAQRGFVEVRTIVK